jgi:uncharacterized membrane protein SirB2
MMQTDCAIIALHLTCALEFRPTKLLNMDYLAIKYLHMACATVSGVLFLLRGFWMFSKSAMLGQRWLKIAPHVVDTALLGSAMTMVFMTGMRPFAIPWLTAKVVALIAYIVLGSIALKRGRSTRVRIIAFATALMTFAYIVSVALTKNPLVLIDPTSLR